MSTLPQSRRLIGALGLVAAMAATLGGCNDWLTAKKLTHNPNQPANAGLDNLFTASQADLTTEQTGQMARTVCIWMQECVGIGDIFIPLNNYIYNQDDFLPVWENVYDGGGLIDLRTTQQRALAVGDSIYAGEASVIEALQVSMAADIWGDIPYKQASQPSTFPTPVVDSQRVVYDSLLTKLATAVTWLGAVGPTNFGSGSDQIFGNDPTLWAAAAQTLRARLFMHMAKRLGTPAYDSAIAAGTQGIAVGGDLLTYNDQTANGANLWAQFNNIYSGDIAAGQFMVNLLVTTSDPRLAAYWLPIDTLGDFAGGPPGGGAPPSPSSVSTFNPNRVAAGLRLPALSYAENELILAEAYFKTSDAASATLHLNNEQTAAGVPLTPQASISLAAIMNEKYIALFQSLEIWNDWKRTGLPVLINPTLIPRRLAYPLTEQSANPNVPGDGPANNWNDPP
jgi:hypothetical protein